MSNETFLRQIGDGLMNKLKGQGYKIVVSEYCSNVKSNTTQLTRQPGATLNFGDAIVIVVILPSGADVRLLSSHNSPCTGVATNGIDADLDGFSIKQCGKNSEFAEPSAVWYNITSFDKAEFFYFVGTYSSQH